MTPHWESARGAPISVSADAKHSLYYDYGGFPREAYALPYAPRGDPALAGRIVELLKAEGVPAALSRGRGLDHGVFVPMYVADPEATLPVVAVSISSSLDPALHARIGLALSSLRSEGVLVIGSGSATHNFDAISTSGGPVPKWAREFDAWLETVFVRLGSADLTTATDAMRDLLAWEKSAPNSRLAHPREDHFVPFISAAAAGNPAAARAALAAASPAPASAEVKAADDGAARPEVLATRYGGRVSSGYALSSMSTASFVLI